MAKRRTKAKRCGICEFWDCRPESGMDEYTGYCRIKRRIVRFDYWCKEFAEKEEYGHPEMYPEIEEELEDWLEYEE